MKVAVLFDEINPQDVLDDRDVLQQVKVVTDSLMRLGHSFDLIPCNLDLNSFKSTINSYKPDMCFNLLDTLDSKDCLAHLPIAVLDANQIKHTGPTANILSQITRKKLVKDFLILNHIPTPSCNYAVDSIGGQWILKGCEEDGSFAMSDSSVISGDSHAIMNAILRKQIETGRNFFAEQYIDGREFTVPFLCGNVLPVVEVTYRDYPKDKPKILAQAAKWQPDSFEYKNTVSKYEFDEEDDSIITYMEELTGECIELFHLRGWGRVDFRVQKLRILYAKINATPSSQDSQFVSHQPYVIDINSNSCLAPDAWWAGSLAQTGIELDEAIQQILDEPQ